MKINYTMLGYAKTGGVIALTTIMNMLSQRGHQISVTLRDGHIDWLSPEIKQIAAVDFHYRMSLLAVRGLNGFYSRILNKQMYLYLYRTLDILENLTPECDINVATHSLSAFPVLRSGKGIPFYHMQHFEVLFSSDHHIKAMSNETYYLPLKKIANSLWLKSQVEGKTEGDIPVINPAIEHEIFKPRADKTRGLKRIVCYGSNIDWKGFSDALDAMKLVFKKRRDIEWVVFGLSHPKLQHSEAPYKFMKDISNEQLAELYSSAHVVICPSWYESFPLPPIEAMACGAPVVSTRIGTEDYCFHEHNCLVVPPRDPHAMSEAILRLLNDEELSSTFIQNGLETVKQFTWKTTVDKVEALFKRTLDEGK
jgi:glycosyltransferase involved in cell wall biosynthesis